MHLPTNAMAGVLSGDIKPNAFYKCLDCRGHITNPISNPHLTDAFVVLGVLLLNAIIGFMQETRAEKAMEALIQMAAPRARISRDVTASRNWRPRWRSRGGSC